MRFTCFGLVKIIYVSAFDVLDELGLTLMMILDGLSAFKIFTVSLI